MMGIFNMKKIKKQLELDVLNDWCTTFIDYVIACDQSAERYMRQMAEVVSACYISNNLKALLLARNELLNILDDLNQEQKNKLGELIKIDYMDHEKFVAEIISRGEIITNGEFKTSLKIAEKLFEIGDVSNLDALNRIIASFEKNSRTHY